MIKDLVFTPDFTELGVGKKAKYYGNEKHFIKGAPIDFRPYGQNGDRLWVRETFAEVGSIGKPIDWFEYQYRADFRDGNWEGDGSMCFDKWKPSIFMPRAASRITLEVESVRVARLQDISESDAVAEGVQFGRSQYLNYLDEKNHSTQFIYNLDTAVKSYQTLWQSINGRDSWYSNPWVWVITFKKL